MSRMRIWILRPACGGLGENKEGRKSESQVPVEAPCFCDYATQTYANAG